MLFKHLSESHADAKVSARCRVATLCFNSAGSGGLVLVPGSTLCSRPLADRTPPASRVYYFLCLQEDGGGIRKTDGICTHVTCVIPGPRAVPPPGSENKPLYYQNSHFTTRRPTLQPKTSFVGPERPLYNQPRSTLRSMTLRYMKVCTTVQQTCLLELHGKL